MTPRDSNYGLSNIHSHCASGLQDEMSKLGLIRIVSRVGNAVSWKLTESFEKPFYKTVEEVRRHILPDATVDDDIIDMLGVIRAVGRHVPHSTPPKKIWYFAGFVFNGLMRQKYGVALPVNKMFHSRVEEFLREVTSIPMSEEEAKYLKTIIERGSSLTHREWATTSERQHKLVATSEVSKELDEKLDRASCEVLDTIEKIAKKLEDSGASVTWRSFRMDELLLQTVRNMVLIHLQTAPIEAESSLTLEEKRKLDDALTSMLRSVAQVVSDAAVMHNVPIDVLLARTIHNIIAGLTASYIRMKINYAEKHGLV